MDTTTFNKVLKDELELVERVLGDKAVEYSTGKDKLHNFKKSANMRGCSQRQALGGMMIKHTTSIYDMIDATTEAPLAVWEEKITDHINYLVLLKAIIIEEGGV